MRVSARTGWLHLAALACFLLLCGVAVTQLWGSVRAAWVARGASTDPSVYARALGHDPDNADYHFLVAEIYNLSSRHQDPALALEHYQAAVRLNPDRSAHWRGLSRILEEQNEADRSREAMARALETDPNDARTHWAAANLYLRLGDLEAADRELAATAELDVGFVNQVMDLVWRFYEDPDRILGTHVPDTKDGNLVALGYFIGQESQAGAALAWERLQRFETVPHERLAYVDYLIAGNHPHQAYAVFLGGAAEASSIFNGGFEAEPLNGGFDWRLPTSGPTRVRRDTGQRDDGRASLMIEFDGEANPDFSGVWHWLPVEAGEDYQLTFAMRTEAISTDQGVYVEVDGQTSDPVLATTLWRNYSIPFTASSDLVRVRLRRNPTDKFDNRFGGRVWLDEFELAER